VETAAVHLVKIEGAEIVHRRLCPGCAELSVAEPDAAAVIFALPGGVGNLLGRLAEQPEQQVAQEVGRRACPVCSTTISDLREGGLAGCATCYLTHMEAIDSVLFAGRQPRAYEGKVPRQAPAAFRLRQEILRLERMLGELVEDERFEEAAGVRDRLGELSSRIGDE
jgi:protein arginine kinase activator